MTKEQEKQSLENDIERLKKQINDLKNIVDERAKQCDEWNEKRSQARREYERIGLEQAETEKKLGQSRLDIQNRLKDVEKKELQLSVKQQKLLEQNEQFALEKKAHQRNLKDVVDQYAELSQKRDELRDREDKLNDVEAGLAVKKREIHGNVSDYESKKALLDQENSKLIESRNALNTLKEELVKSDERMKKLEKELLAKIAKDREALDKEKKAFEAEKISTQNALNKTKLELIRKEKDLNDKVTEVTVRAERLEIETAGKKGKSK